MREIIAAGTDILKESLIEITVEHAKHKMFKTNEIVTKPVKLLQCLN